MRDIEERCAMTFLSNRTYDNRTAGEENVSKYPIDLTLEKLSDIISLDQKVIEAWERALLTRPIKQSISSDITTSYPCPSNQF